MVSTMLLDKAAPHLVIMSSVACQFENFCSEVFEYGSKIYGSE